MPTIVSRCQVVHFGLLPADVIESTLQTRFDVAPAQARFLAAYSEGRLGRAVALARSPSLLAGREALLDLAYDLLTAPPIKSFKLGEEFRKLAPKLKATEDDEAAEPGEEKAGREPLGRALDLLATYFRDVLSLGVMGLPAQPCERRPPRPAYGSRRDVTRRSRWSRRWACCWMFGRRLSATRTVSSRWRFCSRG